MRGRAVIEAKALLRLPEIATDDVLEFLEFHRHLGIERIIVVEQIRRPVM